MISIYICPFVVVVDVDADAVLEDFLEEKSEYFATRMLSSSFFMI